jgi:hypothetical protein
MTRAVRTKVAKAVVLGAVMIGAGALGGCVSSPDPSVAAAETPASASASSSSAGPAISVASMGVSLHAVAAGRIERPTIQGQARATMAAAKARMVGTGAMNMAQSALSLNPVAMGMSAVGTGMMMGQMAAADAAVAEAEAQAEVQRKANLIVPDEDRPSEAAAILSIADKAAGASTSWTNPATGASGTVTLGKPHKVMDEMGCRPGTRTYRHGGTSRRGDFLICREGEDWYDLS